MCERIWSAAALEVKHRVNRHVTRPQATRARTLIEDTMGTAAFGRDLARALGPRHLPGAAEGGRRRPDPHHGAHWAGTHPPGASRGGQELEDPPDSFGQIADLAARLVLREVQQDAS